MMHVVVNEFVGSRPEDAPALFSRTNDFRFTGGRGRLVHRILPKGRRGFQAINVATTGHQASHLENDRLALTVPVGGYADVELGGRSRRVKPGDAIVLSPSQRFSRLSPQPQGNYESFTVLAPMLLTTMMEQEACRLVQDWNGSAVARQLFRLAFEMAQSDKPLSSNALNALEALIEDTFFDVMDATPAEWPDTSACRNEEIVRSATAYMHDHYQLPISMTEVARSAGVGPRCMQIAFHERLGKTPKQVLLHIRLDALRTSLLRPSPDSTVTSAVMSVGFFHLGRASGSYHERFGELPSETLMRSRS